MSAQGLVSHTSTWVVNNHNYPLGDGLGRSKLVRLVCIKVQAVLSQICDYSHVSVKKCTILYVQLFVNFF